MSPELNRKENAIGAGDPLRTAIDVGFIAAACLALVFLGICVNSYVFLDQPIAGLIYLWGLSYVLIPLSLAFALYVGAVSLGRDSGSPRFMEAPTERWRNYSCCTAILANFGFVVYLLITV